MDLDEARTDESSDKRWNMLAAAEDPRSTIEEGSVLDDSDDSKTIEAKASGGAIDTTAGDAPATAAATPATKIADGMEDKVS